MPMFFALLALLVAAPAVRQARRHRARAVARQVAQAVSLNLPLPTTLGAYERGEGRFTRGVLRRVRQRLEGGSRISDALSAVPELTPRDFSLIAQAERAGQLPAAFERVERSAAQARRFRGFMNPALAWAYAVLLGAILLIVYVGALVFIAPKLRETYQSLGTELPWISQATFQYGPGVGVILGPISCVLLLGALGWALQAICLPRSSRENPLKTWGDTAFWFLPITHGVVRDRSLSDAFFLVHRLLLAGSTLVNAVRQAAALSINTVLRRRLRRFATRLEQGQEAGKAARGAKLPRFVATMLGGAERSAGALDATAFLARAYETRFSRSAELLRAAVWPALVLLLGVAVAWLALALFLPMIATIDSILTVEPIHTEGF